jgi:hypothetical protein
MWPRTRRLNCTSSLAGSSANSCPTTMHDDQNKHSSRPHPTPRHLELGAGETVAGDLQRDHHAFRRRHQGELQANRS